VGGRNNAGPRESCSKRCFNLQVIFSGLQPFEQHLFSRLSQHDRTKGTDIANLSLPTKAEGLVRNE
jgi:hypothetical protein